jgi:uncharacterized protein YcnI
MSSLRTALPCALTAAGLAVAATTLAAPPASAHVHVDADDPAPGASSVLTFRVPGESDTGALTTTLTVTLPDVPSARAELMPGWTSRLDRDVAAGTVRSVTWTAAPGTGISPDQFALFRLSVVLPKTDTASFPATQTYSDGTVVAWDQPPLPDGGEPEHPAPMLTMSGADPHGGEAASPTPQAAAAPADNSSRWLAGGALVVAAVAVVVALLGRRRPS